MNTLSHHNGRWVVRAAPHILLRLKRVLPRINPYQFGAVSIADTVETCRELSWFRQRFPLDMSHEDLMHLESRSAEHQRRTSTLSLMLGDDYTPRAFDLAEPARAYQRTAADIWTTQGHLLLGDDVGLGKTVSGICGLTDPRTLPALVVTKTMLPKQWQAELQRFAPDLYTHIITSTQPYDFPRRRGRRPDVVLTSYSKLRTWADALAGKFNTIIYDEVQELRSGTGTDAAPVAKGLAAQHVSEGAAFRVGLSATPIYNYGGEIYNILSLLCPDVIGTREEFHREWCVTGPSGKMLIRQPDVFGTYLRDEVLMLRRTRADVGRELPPSSTIIHHVDSNPAALERIKGSAGALARIILDASADRQERFRSSGELDAMVRQATGIAKAPYVAEFVRMLLETGEKVVLFGWHHAVYDIWEDSLCDFRPARITGHETTNQKLAAKQRFIDGDTPLLILSLRSGEGIDGLQHVCRTGVFGELDWAPGVHEQCKGRIERDGQPDPTAFYFLLSEEGADPIMADVLSLKRMQSDGIRNPGAELIERPENTGDHVKRLAEAYLRRAA